MTQNNKNTNQLQTGNLRRVDLVILQLEPAPSFRCVSAAEADVISARLYAGHRARKQSNAGETTKKENGQGRATPNTHSTQTPQSGVSLTLLVTTYTRS